MMTSLLPPPEDGLHLVALFGQPVSHSLSPAMHNAAFDALNLPFRYQAMEVFKTDLPKAVSWVRSGQLAGANLTIPHKKQAVSLVDRLGPVATVSGAVNTLVLENDTLVGYDTDGPGYLADLSKSTGFDPQGRRVILLGAGGAARAVATSLAHGGCASIVVAARRTEAAAELAHHLEKHTDTSIRQLGHDPLWEEDTKPDLVINATPLGLQLSEGSIQWAETRREIEQWLPPTAPEHTLFSDLIYTPSHTPFLEAGVNRGSQVHGGLGMLLHQGALGFAKWTGEAAPIEVMEKALKDGLARRSSSETN